MFFVNTFFGQICSFVTYSFVDNEQYMMYYVCTFHFGDCPCWRGLALLYDGHPADTKGTNGRDNHHRQEVGVSRALRSGTRRSSLSVITIHGFFNPVVQMSFIACRILARNAHKATPAGSPVIKDFLFWPMSQRDAL
jgi:hypothetical protein